VIALDSNLFIYMLEAHPEFGEDARRVFVAIEQTGLDAVASELVFMEVLGYKGLNKQMAENAQTRLEQFGIKFIPISRTILLTASRLRRELGLGPLDAVHAATAIESNCSSLVTNDQELLKKRVAEIGLVRLNDFVATLK
jgi:predicted nucleic acid-binding protein